MDIVTMVANTGGVMGLALFAIWMLNKVWEARLKEAQQNAENLRLLAQQTTEALERNTRALVRLCERLDVDDETDRTPCR